MKHCLAIIAHAGAHETLAEFWPAWKKLRVPIVAFLPEGDEWPIAEQPDHLLHFGKSAHRGPDAFARLLHAFAALEPLGYEVATVIEPDCLPMRDELPDYNAGKLTGWTCKITGGAESWELCILPPWIATTATLSLIASRCASSAKLSHPDCGDLTDRWLLKACLENESPIAQSVDTFGYCWLENWQNTVRLAQPRWCHGWKRKSDYGDLWPH